MNGKLVNLIVTISNIFGLIPLCESINEKYFEVTLITQVTVASILMHISETKHNLPGVYFVSYSCHCYGLIE